MRFYSTSRVFLTNTKSIFLKLFFASVLLSITACGGSDGGTPPPINSAPVATAQSVTTAANTDVTITLSGTDANGDSLSYAIGTQPSNGTISGTAPNLSYSPNSDFSGADSFTFTVNDGAMTSAPATISISVTPPDSTPDPFSFTDVPEALSETLVISDSIIVTGVEVASAVSITGGEYSVNGGTFTSTAGTVLNNQSIVVRLNSSATASATVDATLTVGGVSDTFSVTTSGDTAPPTANIVYPSVSSLTSSGTIIVRGVTVDDGTVISVSVNGTEAITTDNFANWTAEVPLLAGFNTLTVMASDLGRNNNTNVSSVEVESRPIFRNKDEIYFDNTANKLVFFDDGLQGLYDFDSASLQYSLISDRDTPDTNNRVGRIRDFDISEVTNSAYMLDENNLDKIVQVDLGTGLRSVITADTQSVAVNTLLRPNHIQIDAAANTAYILDSSASGSGRRAILKFDLATGTASVLTENTFTWPDSIALDKANNRILLADTFSNNRIFAFDLDTGDKSTLWDSSNTLDLGEPKGIAVDSSNNRALIYDDRSNGIFAIDLDTGIATTVLNNVALSVSVFTVMDMVYDGANGNNRVFIAANNNRVVQIDLTTGVESIFSSNTIPNAINPLRRVTGLALDTANNRLLVTDAGGTVPSLLAVDLTTGERIIISNSSTPDATNPLVFPTDVGVLANNNAYVIDFGNLSFMRIDMADGARSIISDNTFIDANNTFGNLIGIAQDEANNRTLVVDNLRDALLSVDNFTGVRAVISDPITPNGINPLDGPTALIIQGGRALISDFITDSIISVDLITGARTVLSGPGVPNSTNEFNGLVKMVLDTVNNRLLVIDDFGRRVMAVSLVDGLRSILTSSTVPDSINPVLDLRDITLDVANQRALVMDEALQAVLAVNLDTGARSPYMGSTPSGLSPLHLPSSIAFDSASNQAIVGTIGSSLTIGLTKVNPATGARTALNVGGTITRGIAIAATNEIYTISNNTLNEVNTSTGALTVISGPSVPDTDNPFEQLKGLTLDEENNLAYVSDSRTQSILSVNLATGIRTLISSDVFPDAVNPLNDRIDALVFDKDNARLLVLDRDLDAIVAVDVATGARTIFSSSTVPNDVNTFRDPKDIILDKRNNRVLVLDSGLRAVIAVDLGTGARSNLRDIDSGFGVANFINRPQEMTLIPSANQLMITDSINGVVLMDLETGEQVILSK